MLYVSSKQTPHIPSEGCDWRATTNGTDLGFDEQPGILPQGEFKKLIKTAAD